MKEVTLALRLKNSSLSSEDDYPTLMCVVSVVSDAFAS